MLTRLPSRLFIVAAASVLIQEATADQKYRVVKGDNLYRIGQRFGVSYEKIMAANGLSETLIYPDQVLVIPDPRKKLENQEEEGPRERASTEVVSAPTAPDRRKTEPLAIPPLAAVPPRPRPEASPSIFTEEDPLGLGVPAVQPFSEAAGREQPFASARRVTKPVPSNLAGSPERTTGGPRFPRSREVPASAQISPREVTPMPLDPEKFPTPSFGENRGSRVPAPGGVRTYVVEEGDSVWRVSRKFGVSPFELRRVNNILFSRLRPGMVLEIP